MKIHTDTTLSLTAALVTVFKDLLDTRVLNTHSTLWNTQDTCHCSLSINEKDELCKSCPWAHRQEVGKTDLNSLFSNSRWGAWPVLPNNQSPTLNKQYSCHQKQWPLANSPSPGTPWSQGAHNSFNKEQAHPATMCVWVCVCLCVHMHTHV